MKALLRDDSRTKAERVKHILDVARDEIAGCVGANQGQMANLHFALGHLRQTQDFVDQYIRQREAM